MKTGHTPSRGVPEYWENCTIPWFTLGDVWQIRNGGRKQLGDTREKISELGLENSAAELLPANTVVLSRTASVGFAGVMPAPMATSQDYWNWVCGPDLLPDYLYWVFRSMTDEFRAMMHGSTHKTIYEDAAAGMRIPVPPFEEQRWIADYLDAECARLDRLIELRAEQANLLRERFEALTGDRVLDAHYARVPIKRVARRIQSGTTPATASESYYESHEIPWWGPSGVSDATDFGLRALEPARWLDRRAVDEGAVSLFPVGTTMLVAIGATLGRVGVLDRPGTFNQQIIGLVPNPHLIDASFLGWAVRALHAELWANAANTTLPILNTERLGAIDLPLPDLERQADLANELDAQAESSAITARTLSRSVALLRERKQALITAAVTGEFDVSAASGRSV